MITPPLPPGQRVAWSSYWPRRSFVGTVVHVRRNTVQVRTKLKFVKIKRLR